MDRSPEPKSAPIFFQQVVLARGESPNWAAAARYIAALTHDDAQYLQGLLGSVEPDERSEAELMADARKQLSRDLDLVQKALEAPAEHNVAVLHTPSHSVYCAAALGSETDLFSAYALILRLSLLFVLDAAGFERPPDCASSSSAPMKGASARAVLCRGERRRSGTERRWR